MITVRGSKRVDLKQFRKDHKLKKISFGSEEELWDILKIKPGHVSPFCLLHDEERKVHYYIDADYKDNLTVYIQIKMMLPYGYKEKT